MCVFVPDLSIELLVNPPDHTSNMDCTQAVACPECHPTFQQAGTLKRHMRQAHQVPCMPDDLFLPLRDAWQGRSICTHCSHVFVDFYRLRDHINKHICPRFDPAQESIVPIINRPDLKMHLRHKSVPGLLLNTALINEIANHCTFCHMRIAARSIRKHFTECHPALVPLAEHFREHVHGMANIGGGRGRCSFCDSECRDTRAHECGVLFQLSLMMGYTSSPNIFPSCQSCRKPLGPPLMHLVRYPSPRRPRPCQDPQRLLQPRSRGLNRTTLEQLRWMIMHHRLPCMPVRIVTPDF